MLPNLRLSGTANDSISDFLAASSARSAAAVAAAAASATSKQNNATFEPVNRSFASSVSSSGWGPMLTSSSTSFANTIGSGLQARTLADHVKESTGWSNQASLSSSMPWAAAVKAPADQHHIHQQQHHALLQQHSVASMIGASSLAGSNATTVTSTLGNDSGNTIGSWTSPETSSSIRSGWNADGSMKSDGVPDDGTAIWGSTKKTGIDWTEKESLNNPPQANNGSERRQPKPEPTISSLNGTEAWGAPASGNGTNQNVIANRPNSSSENSGNNYVGNTSTINNEPLNWGESSSLHQTKTKNGNSSPISNSVWDHFTSNNDTDSERKTTADWLSSNVPSNNSARLGDRNKHLETTSLFNGNSNSPPSTSVMTKNSSSMKNNSNTNYDNNNGRQSASSSSMVGGINSAGTIGSLVGSSMGAATSNPVNDLKQHNMSANFSTNDLLESSPNRQTQANILSNQQTQSQLSSYSLGVTPSRELLKQMVQQIQLAVQAGHLNAHILNQPLSTPTLQLVYTLLQQIKSLQQLQEIQQRTRSVNKSNDVANNATQHNSLELQINRVQQNISLLQKAITQQQSALTKNKSLVEANNSKQLQQQQANNASSSSYNSSYANISKLSTNMKVPSNQSNITNAVNNSNNIDSFRRSSLIDTLSNSNSDQLRSEAQARFEINANHDKNLSPILQSSASLNNILNSNKTNDFVRSQSSANNQNTIQQAKGNLLSSTSVAQASPASAWLAFTQGDLSNIQSDATNGLGWSRSSSNNEQSQFNNDILSDLSSAKAWLGASFLSSDGRDNATSSSGTNLVSSSMAPGSNLARPNSSATSNNLKQMSEKDILNRDQSSLYYDWNSSNQTSDSVRRNLDAAQSTSFSSAIGGLSLQSNPWLFAPTSSNSLNIEGDGLDNLIGSTKDDAKNKSDNSNTTDKLRQVGRCDPLSYLSSTQNAASSGNNAAQRALYDWSDMTLAATSLQYISDNISIGSNKQTASSGLVSSAPGPPPGLMSNLGTSSVNKISSILESSNNNSDNSTSGNSETQQPMPSRESSNSLWSGAWFD